ncbi:MAG: hypothetical protein ACSHXI_15495 [Hoeflea sp.]|uniref:hypothetical protein n=1 Tax=Hoeflea sp. TaxID=1940281 RepID=UPI003EF67F1F
MNSYHVSAQLLGLADNSVKLESAGLGAKGIYVADEFFAPLTRTLADESAVFIEDRIMTTANGWTTGNAAAIDRVDCIGPSEWVS